MPAEKHIQLLLDAPCVSFKNQITLTLQITLPNLMTIRRNIKVCQFRYPTKPDSEDINSMLTAAPPLCAMMRGLLGRCVCSTTQGESRKGGKMNRASITARYSPSKNTFQPDTQSVRQDIYFYMNSAAIQLIYIVDISKNNICD